MAESLLLLDGLADIWEVFDIRSIVAGVGGGIASIPTLFHEAADIYTNWLLFIDDIFLMLKADIRHFCFNMDLQI